MRPLWTDTELAQNRPDDWTFSGAERNQVQAAARLERPEAPAADAGDAEQAGR